LGAGEGLCFFEVLDPETGARPLEEGGCPYL